jgi:hypothetical protein
VGLHDTPCPAGTVEGSVSRAYDTSFRLVSEKVNAAHEATFAYDDHDLIETITAGGKTMTITRDPERGGLMRVRQVTLGHRELLFPRERSGVPGTGATPLLPSGRSRDQLLVRSGETRA